MPRAQPPRHPHNRRDVSSRIGCGIDIVELDRFRKSLKRGGDAFLSRIYTPEELRYARRHRDPSPHLAARFAAKEAVMKAMSQIEPARSLAFRQIEITNDRFGRPYVRLPSVLAAHTVHVSLSHADHVAVASAFVADGVEPPLVVRSRAGHARFRASSRRKRGIGSR